MSQDYIALEWVKGEIQDTLQQAQQSLEAYGENPADKSRLKFCFSYLHQVHGTLQMVEFYGAALLAEEMEAVAAALVDGKLRNERDGLSVLMQAIIQLPHYLDHIKLGNRDLPVVLLPILNELRSARGENLLSETALFSPRIVRRAVLTPRQLKRYTQPDFLQWIQKVRQMFQAASAQLLQNKKPDVAMEYLLKVFSRLNSALGHTPHGVVWLPSMAFIEWLQAQNSVPASAKLLLRELDAMLKELIQDGAQVLNHAASDDLVKNLLFYVARTSVQGDAISEAQKAYHLDESLPTDDEIQRERDALSGPDRDTIGQVLSALAEEIASIKDRLDMAMREGQNNTATLESVGPALKQVADTMGMLGLGAPRRTIQEQSAVVEDMLAQGQADQTRLFDVAGALLFVEATMAGMIREGNLEASGESSALTDAQKAVLREARNVLEQVKDAIIAYVGNQWNVEELHDIPGMLYTIAGSLRMLPLADVAQALTHSAPFIENLIATGERCGWDTLDSFADVLSGVEYYIERYSGNPDESNEKLMERVWTSLEALTGQPRPADAVAEELAENLVEDSVAAAVETEVTESALESATDVSDAEEVEYQPEQPTEITTEPEVDQQPEAEPIDVAEPAGASDIEMASEVESQPEAAVAVPAAPELDQQSETGLIEVEEPEETSDIELMLEVEDQPGESVEITLEPELDQRQEAGLIEVEESVENSDAELTLEVEDQDEQSIELTVEPELDQQPEAELIEVEESAEESDIELVLDVEDQPEQSIEISTEPVLEYEPEAELIEVEESAEESVLDDSVAANSATDSAAALIPAGPIQVAELKAAVDNDLIDDDIIEIFLEEAGEVTATLDDHWPVYKANLQDADALTTVRRAFHTLKGSGRMVQALIIGELAWSVENLFNRIIDKTVEASPQFLELVEHVISCLPALIDDFRHQRDPSIDTQPLMDYAFALAAGTDVPALSLVIGSEEPAPQTEMAVDEIVVEESVVEMAAPQEPVAEASEQDAEQSELDDEDRALLEVFTQEANNHLTTVAVFVTDSRHQIFENDIDDHAQRALHTLKGSAHMAGITGIACVAGPMERMLKELRAYGVRNSEALVNLLDEGSTLIRQGLEDIESLGSDPISGAESFLAKLAEFETRLLDNLDGSEDSSGKTVDPQAIAGFLASGMDSLLDADQLLMQWQRSGDLSVLESLCSDLVEVADGAEKADQGPINELSIALHAFYQQVARAPLTDRQKNQAGWSELAMEGQEELLNMMDCLAAGQALSVPAIQNDIQQLTDELQQRNYLDVESGVADSAVEEVTDTDADMPAVLEIVESEAEEPSVDDMAIDGEAGEQWDSSETDDVISVIEDAAYELVEHEAESTDEEIVLDVVVDDNEYSTLSVDEVELEIESDDLGAEQVDAEPSAVIDGFELETDVSVPEQVPADAFAAEPQVDFDEPQTTEPQFEASQYEEPQNETVSPVEYMAPPIMEVEEDGHDEIVEIFLEESEELLESIDQALEEWRASPDNLVSVARLQRDLHTIKGGARMAELPAIADVCHELETIYERLNNGRLDSQPGMFDLLQRGHDVLGSQIDDVKAGMPLSPATSLLADLRGFIDGEIVVDPEVSTTKADVAQESPIDQTVEPAITSVTPVEEDTADATQSFMAEAQAVAIDESDREILEIFIDESSELHEGLDQALHDWEQDPSNMAAAEEAQRVLHTLKGGARLAGLLDIGDQAHDFESRIVRVQQGYLNADAEFFRQAHLTQDELAQKVEKISAMMESDQPVILGEDRIETVAEDFVQPTLDMPVEDPAADNTASDASALPDVVDPDNFEQLSEQLTGSSGSDNETSAAAEVRESNVVPLRRAEPEADVTENVPAPVATTPKLSGTPLVDVATAAQQVAARRAPQELVKVSADLLDDLVNLAGETSIGRGRLEQQITDFSFTLEEMEGTLDRLRDQLRRLDMETEAQVLFRQERQGPDYEDFDPLEMDRYSTIQQLSRALVESASDLLDLKETLSDRTRDAETLLLQQSRINTELQEGLMKTRMVQFQRLVPRLRRIVRQVSQELGKQVDFRILNADGELDRTILERMISPLEHMVRNSVDHGVESVEERIAAGKPEMGLVQLEVGREGGDVVLTLRDDGKGINRAAVRAEAIERGLLTPDARVSDHDLLQFILQAGFSTAKNVTQISGRGVGLDVVSTEIKQLGGSVEIRSEEGQGTLFEVRLPFTVSVNRALMVRTGDDLYAVPLNNIRGIVRASVKDLQALYEMPASERFYEYSGDKYSLEYLGHLLETDSQPKIAGTNMPLPVLLVNGPVPYALQVDSLLGSREIVVKTLGPQFASVMGVSGGTILGDGSVVIILDLPALIRTHASIEYQQARLLDNQLAEQRVEQDRPARIMVVDDSVTVRKVTTRLLERNGMEVITAQDGVDAMETLQDHMPDLMLLDIEMPRMDGFELASLIRHDSRLKHIPIIMITSRTGDKHRERALSIGVNEYMGKPFQEEKLLSTMNGLLGVEAAE